MTDRDEAYEMVERNGLAATARALGVHMKTLQDRIARDRKAGRPVPEVRPRPGADTTDAERYALVVEARETGFTQTARRHSISRNTLLNWESAFLAPGGRGGFSLPARPRTGRRLGRLRILGRSVRAARESAGLTPDAAAEAIGISFYTYRNYEAGVSSMEPAKAEKLAEALGVPLDSLLAP